MTDTQPTNSILICLLGDFRVLRTGQHIALRGGGKAENLLCKIALRPDQWVSRDALLLSLWPDVDAAQASQSLSTLLYKLNRLLSKVSGIQTAVLHNDGYYRLNAAAGVVVDTELLDNLADAGEEQERAGNLAAAVATYTDAVQLYRGDLCICAGSDTYATVERERLRARYLTLLTYLADYHYRQDDYTTCLHYARRLVTNDPCREDAHRLIMRCYVRRGERAQAFRQYQLCQNVLRTLFDAVPEAATTALFDQVRLNPESI